MTAVDDAHLRVAFNRLDHRARGFVTPADVESLLGDDAEGVDVTEMFQGSEFIDEEAFVSLCRSQNHKRASAGTLLRSKSLRMSANTPRSPSPNTKGAKAALEEDFESDEDDD